MVLGMSLDRFTLLHVVISIVGIVSGFVVAFGLLAGKRLNGLTAIFLLTTLLTSLTGYGFKFEKLLPAHIVGAISLALLTVAIVSRYVKHMAGGWRAAYVISASAALYLNVFVLVVQLFLKVPDLHRLAPTQAEPPFAIAQGTVLLLFVVLGIFAVKKFRQAA